MKKLIMLVTVFLATSQSFASERTQMWMPVVDNPKCAAALGLSLPAMAGLAVEQLGAGFMDFTATLSTGKLCIESSKYMSGLWRPVLTSLVEMGCIAPMADIANPIYYSHSIKIQNSDQQVSLFRCNKADVE